MAWVCPSQWVSEMTNVKQVDFKASAATKKGAPRATSGFRGLAVSGAVSRPSVLRERIQARLLGLLEWFALRVLPRGTLRKRLLAQVDRGFAHLHRQSCIKDSDPMTG